MKRFMALALGSILMASAPALAGSSQKFETTLTHSINSPISVEVVIGEDLAFLAENMSPRMADRSSRRLNAAFADKGYYGNRDLDRLAERLERKLESRLEKYGVATDPNAATKVRLVITDADPNRPTFNQLGKEPGLSYESFAIGGAEFEGSIFNGDTELGTLRYAWYETDIRDAKYGGTWSDANRAIDRFAKKTAKMLASAQSGAGS